LRSTTRVLLLTLTAALLGAAGCARTFSPAAGPQAGKSPVPAAAPRRIVSLAPNITEILYALGLQDRLVADTAQCTYPPEARRKPHIGDVSISVERVVSMKPDLVVAHAFLNRAPIQQLKGLKIPVVAVDPHTLDQVATSIEQIATACGVPARGQDVARQMRTSIQAVSRGPEAASAGPKVLFAVQGNPLWAAGPETFVDEMIRLAGGRSVSASLKPGFNMMSGESAVASAPDVIIVTDPASAQFFHTATAWRNTPAVRHGRVIQVDPDLFVRPGPRLAAGMRQMSDVVAGRPVSHSMAGPIGAGRP